jgi:hypothetical protein
MSTADATDIIVFTVCDNAVSEVCPVWPGQPMTAHWGVPDPAAIRGTQEQVQNAFRDAFLVVRSKNQSVPQFAPCYPGPALVEKRNRQHRTVLNFHLRS